MNSKTIMKGAIIAFCIIGMLVLPAAAAGQATTTGQASAIDQGLKDDLWASHHTYRLQEFDSHVTQANNVIAILGRNSIDTTRMQATLTTISGERSALDTALTNKDRDNLKTINAALVSDWKQFAQEMKDAVRAHYTAARAAAKAARISAAGTTGTTGTTSGPDLSPSEATAAGL
jgi:hypothetical protein